MKPLAAKLVETFLPFNLFSTGDMFSEIMVTSTDRTTSPMLPLRRVKNLLVELYVATKRVTIPVRDQNECEYLCIDWSVWNVCGGDKNTTDMTNYIFRGQFTPPYSLLASTNFMRNHL